MKQEKQIDFMKEMAEFTFTSKYARYNEKEQRRETWHETVSRLEKMHLKRFHWLPKEDLDEIRWAFDQVRSKLVVPSMRSLQFGGKAIEAHQARIFNCLGKNTRFITSEGVKSFADFKDGDEVCVPTHMGRWQTATVRCYGSDLLFPVTITRGKSSQTVWATADHRWLLRDGRETTNLKVGDLLMPGPDIFSDFDYESAPVDEKLYWAYGMVYGDGTVVRSGSNKYSMIRLCGEDKHYQQRFEDLGFSTSSPLSCKGDFIAYTGRYLKTAPDPKVDAPRLIRAFVAGYCAADGQKNKNYFKNQTVKNQFLSIQSSEPDHIEFIRNCFPIAGAYIVSERDLTGQETNYGVRPHTVSFRIINAINNLENTNCPFKVASIGESVLGETWCLDVEEDRSFVLASGLVTGNCSVRHIDSIRSFSESFYLLLCGCGLGIGLSNHFLSRLPDLVNESDKNGTVVTYVIADTIEGWADSVEALLMCYFKNTAYTGRKIVFDYSRIRKKGSPLKTGGGKAPGYKGLKQAHQRIKELLDYIIEENKQNRLKTVNAYDILMHCADAVLSGGIRRSATSVVFQPDDEDMMNAKTFFKVDKARRFAKDDDTGTYHGQVVLKKKVHDVELDEWSYNRLKEKGEISWTAVEPQRARSNNSVILIRGEVTKEQFAATIERTRQFGEPGFVFASEKWQLMNPCQPAWATVLTPNGISTIGSLRIGDKIWSETGWTTVINKWSTGVKTVYSYRTTAGVFYGTENHRVVSGGEKIEAHSADSIDRLTGVTPSTLAVNAQDVMDGIVIGDGSVHKASDNLVHLCIGENDGDYHTSEIASLITRHRPGINEYAWEVTTAITADELPLTFKRVIPDRYVYGNPGKVASFLRGLYTANGSVVANRITLKASSFQIIEQVQLMLSSLGIASYYTTNRPTTTLFSNGEYICKESYDLNITTDRRKFAELIGFIQQYKNDKVAALLLGEAKSAKRPKVTYDIIESSRVSEEEVFDITVDNDSHTYWTGGLNVSNCFEISFVPITKDGVCGVQFCNLTSQNGNQIDTPEKFRNATKAATILGTLQASYTYFPYLSNAARELTEEEALLGVSITGLMDNPQVLLDPALQREMARLAIQINKEWAAKLHIKQAARITCVKPEGTSSLVLSAASGIHPHHARRYFRRVQCNKLDNVYKFAKKCNPHATEESVWSATKTDDVLTFPITVGNNAMVKSDLTAIKHLDIIKSTQQNWVLGGTTEANTKPIAHNVSCTVLVKDDEWAGVIDYLYENRQFFSAVALLPATGDKQYKQAPLEAVVTEEDEKKWQDLALKWQPFDFKKLEEREDETQLQQEVVCGSNGACELIK